MDAKGIQKIIKTVKREASDSINDHHHHHNLQFVDIHYNSKKKKLVVIDCGGGGSGKKSGGGGGGGGMGMRCCQAEKCTADLSESKMYYKRHKVCEQHSKAQVVLVSGIRQRFCQQCSRFHELIEFDETKRSCRRHLAGHNERRRKSSADAPGESSSNRGSDTHLKDMVCGHADDSGKVTIAFQDNAAYKHFQIR